ncbi:hypothetical protein COB72_10855 [bacterium]|nr:MAG: hypothetical protein COB72_10855 [bacterium]
MISVCFFDPIYNYIHSIQAWRVDHEQWGTDNSSTVSYKQARKNTEALMATPTRKKKNRSKLGRGLSALVDQSPIGPIQVAPELNASQVANITAEIAPTPHQGEQVLEIDVTRIGPNPHQPRRVFAEDALEELAQSIAEHGLMQPIVVRIVRIDDAERYELIAGERRWRATCRTGRSTIRAIVLDVDDLQSAQLALIENIQREDLNPIERAHGFVLLSDRFGMTQDQIATKVGISRSSVANFLRLIELDDEIQTMIVAGELGMGHGKVLLSCKKSEHRLELARQARDEEWTVRILEKAISNYNVDSDAQSKIDDSPQGGIESVTHTRMESVLSDLEKRLGDQLGTHVKLKTDQTGTKGSITIDFYNLDHFDGLMNKLGIGNDEEISKP